MLRKLWNWLRDKHNRGALKILGGLFATIIFAGWTLYLHLYGSTAASVARLGELQENILPQVPKPKPFPLSSKRVSEGESFGACGKSDLFLMPLNLGQGIASLNRKHGALFDQSGNMLLDQVMKLDEPQSLSKDCFLTIKETYEVQGHYSFKILIGRKEN